MSRGRPARRHRAARRRPGASRRLAPASAARRGARGRGREPVLRARDRAHAETHAAPRSRRAIRFPCPKSLHDLVHSRLLALPSESRHFLLAALRSRAPDPLGHRGGVRSPLQPGPAARTGGAASSSVDGERVRFTHPLLAAGAYETADPLGRAEVHARLAELLERPEARAWQLAAAVDEPDEEVAAVLEDAARGVRSLGAPRPAALLLDRARELTPSDRREERLRRAVDAAWLHFEAGDSRRAEAQLRDVIAPLDSGPAAGARAWWCSRASGSTRRPAEAKALFAQVIEEAGDDRRTLALAHEGAAACSVWVFERFDEAVWHTDVALALADELGDEALAGDVLMVRLSPRRCSAGRRRQRPPNARSPSRARRPISASSTNRSPPSPSTGSGSTPTRGRARRSSICCRRARDVGDENAVPWLLCLLSEVELQGREPRSGARARARGSGSRRAVGPAALHRARPGARERRRWRSWVALTRRGSRRSAHASASADRLHGPRRRSGARPPRSLARDAGDTAWRSSSGSSPSCAARASSSRG